MQPRTYPPLGRRRALLATARLLALFGLLTSLIFVAAPSATSSAAQGCPAGQTLGDDGVTCIPAVNDAGELLCPAGQQPDPTGSICEDIPSTGDELCPPGQVLDQNDQLCVDPEPETIGACGVGEVPNETGSACVKDPNSPPQTKACSDGYSLGADGVTCVADGPRCAADEIVDDEGECRRSFTCDDGFVLSVDLLTCMSNGCPDDQILSVDGKRCLAADTSCPDGSPRPVGGSCLVVETIEGDDGPQVIVRCDDADLFCQAQVKQCADDRASGATDGDDDPDADCADPRTSCDDEDEACAVANERLVECATRDTDDVADVDDGGGRRIDPCDDLCPPLHRLDPSGECIEYLDPRHPCVSFGRVPDGVTTNRELDGYSYLAGTGQCVTKVEFLRRLGNFEAAAGAEADALALLRETTSLYLDTEDQLAELDAQRIVAEQRIRQLTIDAANADARRAQNEKELVATEKRLTRELELLSVEALGVYVTGGGDDLAIESAILGAVDLIEVGKAQAYGEVVLDDQIDNIERIRTLQTRTEEIGIELAEASAAVEAALTEAISTRQLIDQLTNETEQLRADQLLRRDEEAELVSEMRENKATFARELGVFEQASREIADILSESEFLVTEFRDFGGLFANPVIPADLVSGFGPRLHPILGYVRNHDGLDFDGRFGDPIYASAPGIVEIASSFGGYGETVVLNHGEFHTLYAHMSVIGTEVGAEVQRGDIIGFVGSTGLSTGPHLHFEIWIEGRTAVDPLPYLSAGGDSDDEAEVDGDEDDG